MNPDTPGGRTCSAPDCDRPFRARGFCSSHYKREFGRGPRRELTCSWCGATFLGGDEGKSGRRYCSPAHEAAFKSWRYALPGRGVASGPRSPSCPVWFPTCEECGTTFTARRSNRRFCSMLCAGRSAYRRNPRPGMRGSSRGVSVVQIGDRDGWRCHLCHRKVARKNASRDHLIPRSAGGLWVPENIALAHLRCNSRRGPGRIAAQLLLGLEVAS